MNNKQIIRSIVRIKLGTATDEDRRMINDWIGKKKSNRQVYQDIIRYKSAYRRLIAESELRDNIDLNEVRINILEAIASRKKARRRIIGWGVAAACIAAVIYILLPMRLGEEPSTPQLARFNGDGQVTLVLSSGHMIDLKGSTEDSIRLSDGTTVRNEDLTLYTGDITDPEEVASRNKIMTGTGGYFSFALSDGTRVWLNAQSEITYPARFTENQRVIELKGEAFFEVAPDPQKPFIVETGGMRVKALGTSFNVSAYGDEDTMHTSLLSGRVEVTIGGEKPQKVILEPGMQSVWVRNTERLYSQKADMETIASWKSGEYIFRKAPLDAILRSLSRWYDVEFENEAGDLSEYTFSGKVAKGDLLLYTLETFTLAGGPGFEIIDNNTIRIMNK